MKTRNHTSISLVLGSGGARGLAHIGVIHWLEQHGFKIASISGCSSGALIGGIYAAGKLDEFEAWVQSIRTVDIVTFMDLSWKKSGLVKGDKIINTLTNLVGDVMIEDLPINYTAVASDINNEKEVWINSGRLFDAIRASISLPLLFTPFQYKGIELIDGGVLNPVPIAPTFNDATDLTIAVNLGGKVNGKERVTLNTGISEAKKTFLSSKIAEFLESFKEPSTASPSKDRDAYDIANQAFDAMQSTIARQKLAAYPADYFIEVARNACGMLEFDRASEMISLGYQAAEKSLQAIKNPENQKA
ncbi:patatin-like phospholipase family protein [Amphritea sp. 1_MG-2023]|uniref:patatin-like phospholipase family protein n=1 Tax=Amphritea sp. 1_MG-2023 TaxID=3062670 RepID=UPI0026E40E97|nr:patatin-like phospholipase family protein [Amphritea sp. 1_MG-2023]MDO6562344.1 patatin-like phospholipase family protein [Amphritea sp. 1_MG-2023]